MGGGAQIYSGLLDLTDVIDLTEVDLDIPGDALFPSSIPRTGAKSLAKPRSAARGRGGVFLRDAGTSPLIRAGAKHSCRRAP